MRIISKLVLSIGFMVSLIASNILIASNKHLCCRGLTELSGTISSYTLSSIFKIVGAGKLLRGGLFPLDGATHHYGYIDNSNAVEVITLDGIKLRANYLPPKNDNAGVVVMFHGNGMTGDSWLNSRELQWFRSQGLGVITPTIRGYPGSEGSCSADFDKSLLLDTEAIVRFLVKEQGINLNRIVSFGLSLGGSYAATLSHYFRTPLILHNSWTRVGEVVGNITGFLPDILTNRIGEAAITWSGQLKHSSEDLGMYSEMGYVLKDLVYDAGDTIRKLEYESSHHLPNDVLIIFAHRDNLMGGKFRAEQLYNARYPDGTEDRRRIFGVQGGHCSLFCGVNDSHVHKEMVFSFLYDNGFVE